MGLFENLCEILKPVNVEIGSDFVAFDFGINKAEIYTGNLTPEVIELINSAETIEKHSYLIGYKRDNEGNKAIFEASAHYWSKEDLKEHAQYMQDDRRKIPHWHIESIGGILNGKNIQFNNEIY